MVAQVGKDQRAQAFLATLDNDPVVGKMVDATSYYELEAEEYSRKGVTLTPGARSHCYRSNMWSTAASDPYPAPSPAPNARCIESFACHLQTSGWSS